MVMRAEPSLSVNLRQPSAVVWSLWCFWLAANDCTGTRDWSSHEPFGYPSKTTKSGRRPKENEKESQRFYRLKVNKGEGWELE